MTERRSPQSAADTRALHLVQGAAVEQILDATFDIWHDGLSRTAYSNYWAAQQATPWGRAHLTRYALESQGEVAASAKLYELDAMLDRRPIRIAGIGAVFTMPAHRGRGAGREVVERVVQLGAERGADAALLFSEIDPEYYARLGFIPIPRSESIVRVVEDSRRGAPATMVRTASDPDLPSVVAMDADRAEPFRFHLVRGRDLAHYAVAKRRLLAGLSPPHARALQFFVAEEGASPVAYVVISAHQHEWTIDSCGDRDPAGARLGAILQVLIAREPAELRPTISGWLPPNLRPPQLVVEREYQAKDVMMVRPLTEQGEAMRGLRGDDVFYWKGDLF
jgi:predicted N-acetyltransferase YhbS